MRNHYVRKGEDPAYALECDHERNATFLAVDVNMNGMLDLDEWKVFCRRQVANLSARTKVSMVTVDEAHMEIAWKIN